MCLLCFPRANVCRWGIDVNIHHSRLTRISKARGINITRPQHFLTTIILRKILQALAKMQKKWLRMSKVKLLIFNLLSNGSSKRRMRFQFGGLREGTPLAGFCFGQFRSAKAIIKINVMAWRLYFNYPIIQIFNKPKFIPIELYHIIIHLLLKYPHLLTFRFSTTPLQSQWENKLWSGSLRESNCNFSCCQKQGQRRLLQFVIVSFSWVGDN